MTVVTVAAAVVAAAWVPRPALAGTCQGTNAAWISGAIYGRPGRLPTAGGAADVTGPVQALSSLQPVVFIPASVEFSALFGNPLVGTLKELHVTFTDGKSVSASSSSCDHLECAVDILLQFHLPT